VTVLEGVLPKGSVLLCDFCGQKDSMQRIFTKKCFLFTVGSAYCVKQFTSGSRNMAIVSLMTEEVETQVQKCLSQQSKDFYAVGFDALVKAIGHVYHCWWRICQEINEFSKLKYHMFYISYLLVTYLLTPQHRLCHTNDMLHTSLYMGY
jgi:hypothetical protein